MSRLKRNQNIDGLTLSIQTIAKSQCSLSAQDLIVLDEVLSKLQSLKRKKGLTNKQLQQEVVKIVELITKFFTKSEIDE